MIGAQRMIGHPAALFLLLTLACSTGDVRHPFEPLPGSDIDPVVAQFVVLVNQYRATVGCPQLEWDANVAGVAQDHSEDMVERDFFSHTNPDGASAGNRLSAAGVSWTRWGENIAAGYATAEAVLGAWLDSEGHRRNIESCAFQRHGVGLADNHWTHVFMTP